MLDKSLPRTRREAELIDSSLPRTLEEAKAELAQAQREYAAHAWDQDAARYQRVVEELTNLVQSQKPLAGIVLNVEIIGEEQPAQTERNECRAAYGPGPEEKRCGECQHLHTLAFWSGRRAYKCDLRKLTHSHKTDHSPRWQTCARFAEGQGPVHSIDTR